MAEFRENYIKAREIIADELKEKYNLVESYREYNRLTLDSTTHSIHFTFYVPDGDEVYISEKGKQPADGDSFAGFMFEEYPDDNERISVSKKVYQSALKTHTHDKDEYTKKSIYFSFFMKTNYLENKYPDVFQVNT